ncbi:Dolichyl-phosphate-mannose-protein mannosyltransferase [Hymenobacter gelipurpurascens]|uniref:Dolichyl-phosphate-mannose-protein mannosyltransferase n=1 Tax=Hymenobacter gelipurpurascens TaxID=89968 RepID=A0A212TDG1_9BACT|nr:Dolichyl-phosphate-mannose-protein mannosyltransferase [Hymenobacter gelipurpurascens]
MFRSRNLQKWWWLALIPTAWFSLFWRLGALPLQSWDESLLAVSAAEMLRNHQWFLTYFGGAPDLWNTKPPLLIWLQALSLHTFGYSEWALRLPTALAATALVVVVASFARRWLGGPLAGLLAGLALLSSKGFVAHHVARTGDYETLLLLFTTSQVLAVFAWLQTRQRRYLLLAGGAIGLAILTKGVAGLFLVPGLALEVLRRRKLPGLLREPATWVAVLLAVGPPLVWYTLREQMLPGYLAAVWQNELGGRLLENLEQQSGPWYTYLLHFVTQQFLLWTPWVVACIWAIARRPIQRPAHRFLAVVAWSGGVFLGLISVSATKHTWYDAPLYPLLALLLGAGLPMLARQTAVRVSWRNALVLEASVLMLAVVPSLAAVYIRLNKTHKHRHDEPMLAYGRYLQHPGATPARSYTLLHTTADRGSSGYNAPLEFHALARRAQFSDTVNVVFKATTLPPGQVVLLCGAAARNALIQRYATRLLYQADSCATYQIQRRLE